MRRIVDAVGQRDADRLVFVRRRQIGIGVLAEVPRFHDFAPVVCQLFKNCRILAAVASRCSTCGRCPASAMVSVAALGNERRIALEIFGRHDAVACAAQKQRRHVHAVQAMLELGIVHVRLPGQQRQRLVVAGDDAEAPRRTSFARSTGFLAGSWKRSRSSFSLRHRKDVGDVELVGLAGLDADRTDQRQAVEPLRHLRGDIGGDPAADREADEIGARQAQAVHQLEIDVGDVVDAVEPVRQRRLAEARMRRRDHAPLLRQQLEKRQVEADAAAAVQIEERRALPALEHIKLDTRDRNHIGGSRCLGGLLLLVVTAA